MALAWAAAIASADSSTCTITGTAGPIFGTYDVLSSLPVDAAGSINYSCTGSAKPEVMLSAGISGSFATRTMASGSSRLRYNLYLNAGRTQVWGDGSGGTRTYQGPSGSQRSVPVFGRVPALQADVGTGEYADTIVVTFAF